MHKNRPFLLLLLILLSLDLLVFFTGLSNRESAESRFEEAAEEVVEFFSETEERCEEESETFGFGMLCRQQLAFGNAFQCSERLFFSPGSSACSLAFGWRMPLLI